MRNRIVSIMTKVLVVLLIVAAFVLGIYMYTNAKDDTKETSKIESELDFMDTKITSIINRVNGINFQNYKISVSKVEQTGGTEQAGSTEKESSKKQESGEKDEKKAETQISEMEEEKTVSKDKEADWDWIQGETEIFYSIWGAIVLDLYDIGISSDKIVGFSNTLDQALIAVKNRDKALSVGYYAKLYNFLSEFANSSDISDFKKNAINSKNHVINAYAYIQEDIWDKAQIEVAESKNDFTKIINDISNSESQKNYSINKTYILIEEMKNSLATKDKEIFYIKYKNLLEAINALL